MKRLTIITLIITLLAVPALAVVPQLLNVQGVLMDGYGNPLPDDNHYVKFELWNAETGGSLVWFEELMVYQIEGVFNAILGEGEEFYPELLSQNLWMRIIVDGDDPTEPRIQLTSVATALRAGSVDPGAAVRTLNGMTNHVDVLAGANITITQVADSALVISAVAGSGGEDTDWVISGDDITHEAGTVYVGGSYAKDNPEKSDSWPVSSKMEVQGVNEGMSVYMGVNNALQDGRSSIFGMRSGSALNHGTGYGADNSNAAITGYNANGDSYTWAVSGFANFNYANTGAILGAHRYGGIWAALAYRDDNNTNWGVYTNSSMHAGYLVEANNFSASGLTETNTLKVANGAVPGHILTSDIDGNATWSAPSAVESDGDWNISGMNVIHPDPGVVAVGSNYAYPLANMPGNTTVQISAPSNPALTLDATGNGLTRWSMFLVGDEIRYSKTDSYSVLGSTSMSLSEGELKLNDFNGNNKITLQAQGVDSQGGRYYSYSSSTYTTAPTVSLESQTSSSRIGGSLLLRDQYGQEEIIITANHDGTHIGRVTTPVLEITGGADLSEQFDLGNASLLTKPGMVVSIDPLNPGKLTLSDKAYDRKVAGVLSGAGGVKTGMLMGQRGTEADGELPVALVGRVYVWADASSAPIEPGDMLTTSDLPGHAMKVTDFGQATGAILGKAMTGLSEGQGLILTLVTLQ